MPNAKHKRKKGAVAQLIRKDLLFSKSYAYIYALVFALIGSFFLIRSFATGPSNPPSLTKGADAGCSLYNQEAPLLSAAGAKWIRFQTLSWPAAEPSKGTFSTSYLDRLKTCFNFYHQNGIKIMALVDDTPQWATTKWNPTVHGQPAANGQDFADLFSYIVPYLGSSVDAWEIYNEPNLSEFWTGTAVDYANLLSAAYPAIKAADVKAGLCPTQGSNSCQKVVMAGLDMHSDAETANKFLSTMYQLTDSHGQPVAKADADVIALHPYPKIDEKGDSFACKNGSDVGLTITKGIPNDYKVMANNGDGSKPIWLTEWGYDNGNCMDPALDYIKAYEPYVQSTMWFFSDGVGLGNGANGLSTTENAIWLNYVLFDDPYIKDSGGNLHWRIGPGTGWTFKDVSIDWGDGSAQIINQPPTQSAYPVLTLPAHTYPKLSTEYTAHVTMNFTGTGAAPQSFNCLINTSGSYYIDCPSTRFSISNKNATVTIGASPWLVPNSKYQAMQSWPAGQSAPSVSLATTGSGANISVLTSAQSDYNNVKRVDYYNATDNALLQTISAAPYDLDISKLTVGVNYKVYATATDYLGKTSTRSDAVSFSLTDTTKPTVSITSPTSGAIVSGKVNVTANASDNVALAKVDFMLDGATLIGTDSSAPYSVSWDTSKLSGMHTLTAVATDTAGNTTTSKADNVTIADSTAPSVSISSPTTNSVLKGKLSTTALASDNVAVSSVQFKLTYPDGTIASLGPLLKTSPYNYNWDTTGLANGNYKLTAVATDTAGNTATSATIGVAINNQVSPPSDKTPPNTPSGLTTTNVDQTSVTLNWNASTDNSGGSGVKDYSIYRNNILVGTTTLLSYTDSGLKKYTAYKYSVSAEDNTTPSNQSAKSSAVSVRTVPPAPEIQLAQLTGLRLRGLTSLTADASSIAGVANVQFYINPGTTYDTNMATSLGAADTSDPFSVSFDTTKYKDGSYAVTAIASDSTGQKSQPATIVAVIDNTTPALTFKAPRTNAKLHNTIEITTHATDNDQVAGVQYYLDNKLLGSEITAADQKSEYSYVWDTTNSADGQHSLSATVFDQAGNSNTDSLTVSVANHNSPPPDTDAPTAPVNLATTSATANNISLSWNSSTDNGGSGIAGYAVYRDGTFIASTSQTNFTDTNLKPGTSHVYTVSAFDNAGNSSDRSGSLTIATESIKLLSGDADGNGKVDVHDLSIVLTNYSKHTVDGDLNHDGKVTIADLSILLTNFGRKSR